MLDALREMLSYTFLTRALLVGCLVSLCAALLGVTLVLKRYSMIGDGLSHVGFGALAVATALNAAPLSVAIPVVVAAAFLLLRISSSGKIKGDAAIGLLSTCSLAIGVILISLSTGMNTEVSNYLFGSILSMSRGDVALSAAIALGVLILYLVFYNRIFAVTFDETFARATGVRVGAYNALISLLTALTIVVGMRMMGSMLISGLLIFPALSAMRLCKRFRGVIIIAAILSVCCFFLGTVLSYLLAIPTGASVICVNLMVLLLFTAVGRLRERIK
jgi:zinc transport system permease protein